MWGTNLHPARYRDAGATVLIHGMSQRIGRYVAVFIFEVKSAEILLLGVQIDTGMLDLEQHQLQLNGR